YIDVLSSRAKLEAWKMRGVARGLTTTPALLTAVAASINDDRKVDDLCQDALDRAGTTDKATYGTAIHDFTEQIDRGETPFVPPHVQPDIQAYTQVTAGWKVVDSELFVVHDELQVAGTLDRLVEINGRRVIADLKTGSIDWDLGKIAMQLAVYANSQRYDPLTGERTPLGVDTAHGAVIHVPAGTGTAEIVWVNLITGWQGVEIALEVWDWRSMRANSFRIPEPTVDLVGLISLCGTLDSLNGVWWQNQAIWDETAQTAAEQRKAELLAGAS
ncbi:MAG TPA: PD-(D/E)XK nuclease family protein, partial [Asanoa sp.]|nr:PD-(D/E)XK nuclease family protein [Asanoa sp.]